MLIFQTLNLKFKTKDERPAIMCSDAINIRFNQMKLDIDKSAESVFVFDKANDVVISNSKVNSDVDCFLKVLDEASKNIYLMNNILPNVKELYTAPVNVKVFSDGNVK